MSTFNHESFKRPKGIEYLQFPDISPWGELLQGYIHDVFDPQEIPFARRETSGRSVCEAALLLTERSNGKVAVTLTHFRPSFAESHVAVIHAMTSTTVRNSRTVRRHGEGKRKAVLLTTDPMSMDVGIRKQNSRFGALYRALKMFNNGEEPDLIYIPEPKTSEEVDLMPIDALELVYEMSVGIDGKVNHMFEVSGTNFRKEGTFDDILQQENTHITHWWK